MEISELKRAKLRRMFSVYDYDDNGFIERSDYEAVIANLAGARQLEPGSSTYEELKRSYLSVWEWLRREADTDHDGRVSFEEMLHYNERVTHDPRLFQEQVVALGDLLFELLDRDRDGHVTRQEYHEFATCLRFQPGEAFSKLDVDGKGRLSKPEVHRRIHEFYFSDLEDAPGNWLFGPLES